MATSKPFTYNNGSYINGTEQLGNIAIGRSSLDYAKNPGGKKWWMGPDEDNRYIICKDVPTQDFPTPADGNTGSVQFWASSDNDTNFIDVVNRIKGNTFGTVDECLNWLSTNEYWTNYYDVNGQTLISQSSWKIRDDYISTVNGWVGSIFDSDRELFISAVYRKNTALATPWVPYLISSSDFPLSGEAFFSGSGYFLNEGLYSSDGTYGFYYLAQNTSSNHLYALYGDPGYNVNATNRGIIKWDLDTRNRVDDVDFKGDFGDDLTLGLISTYCPGNDKVYVTGRFEDAGYPTRFEIQIYSGSSLSTNRDIITSPGGYGRIYSSTDDSGKVLWINGGGNTSRWYIISGSSFAHTGSITPQTTNSMNPGGGWQAAYSKTSKKFYAMGIKPTGVGEEIAFLWVIDPFNLTSKVVEYGETDTLGQNVGGGCVWDSNRNCIWTLDLDGKLFAIECNGDTIVKSNITLSGGPFGYINNPTVPMVIDTTSDYLILPNIIWDLSKVWPI